MNHILKSITWIQVARCRQFTPAEEDCHTTLKVDVVVVDSMARTPYLEVTPTLALFIQKNSAH